MSLDELGHKHGTDKSSVLHNYLNFYERYFAPLRDKQITLLEIGIFGGASLAVWEEYFPNAKIIGADIDSKTVRFAKKRVKIRILDQSDIEQLTQLAIDHGPFDVIIEDGSHLWEHQITTLKTLFPHLKPGGIYIAEDLQTNFGGMAEGYRGVSSISCVEYLKKLVDLRVADDQLDISREEDPFLRTYGRLMHTITFYRRSCVLEKAAKPVPRLFSDVPYAPVAIGAEKIGFILHVHFGFIGDIATDTSCVRALVDNQNIQGFALHPNSEENCQLEYRSRLADGSWTNWVMLGEFAGSAGIGNNLTGFSVRLDYASKNHYRLQAIGQFRQDSEAPVTVGDGEDCVPQSELSALYGMQILIEKL